MIDRRGAVGLMVLLPVALNRAIARTPLTAAPPLAQFPFELLANAIYFRVKVNGKGPYLFSLDTGSSNSVIASELIAELGIRTGATFNSTGAGSDTNAAAKIETLDFELPGGIRRTVTDGAALSLSGLWPLLAKRFYGIIGFDVLEPFVIEIDYERRIVRLYEPETYDSGSRRLSPAHMYGRYDPQVDGSLEVGRLPRIPVRFTLDTGAGGTIVSSPLVDRYGLIEASGQITETQDRGAGGAMPTEVMARLSAIRIGSFVLNQPLVALSRDRMGSLANEAISVNVGGNILRRFTVVIDYSRRAVGLTPNGHFSEPFASDASGLLITAADNDFHKFTVQSVIPGSPAAAEKLRPGDQIVAANGRPARDYSLWELEELLKRNGTVARLSIRRAGGNLEKDLRLRSTL